jgi:hypothetical protein
MLSNFSWSRKDEVGETKVGYLLLFQYSLHRKESFSIFLSPAGKSLTKLSLCGNNLYMTSLFPPRESLVSEIPAGDGNIEKLFFYGAFSTHKEDKDDG